MTERDIFLQAIPRIAEMVVEARKLTVEEFQEWHDEVMKSVPDKAKPFIKKVFIFVSNNL